MGYSVQEITTGALSSTYPSYYKEFQLRNWGANSVMVTEWDGSQHLVPSNSSGYVSGSQSIVEIEYRYTNGPRTELTKTGNRDKAIIGHRIQVPYTDILNAPVMVHEHRLILSTPDCAILAKKMMCDDRYRLCNETSVDEAILDPRFVLQVNDPCGTWDVLFVNIFGTTVILRSGSFNSIIPASSNLGSAEASLTCYLRYPNNYYSGSKIAETVFDIPLNQETVDGDPVTLGNGATICIASSTEEMQKVKAKLGGRSNKRIDVSGKTVPKEVYDAAVARSKEDLERVKQEAKTRLETLTITKDNKIAELEGQIGNLTRERDEWKNKAEQWKDVHAANNDMHVREESFFKAREAARKESNEAAKSDSERIMTAVKVIGGIATVVASFAIGMAVKANKDKK